MTDQTIPPGSSKTARSMPIEDMLLADFRDLLTLDRTTPNKALIDQVVAEVARQRAAAVGQFILDQLREMGYGQVERDAAAAAERGEIQ